MTCSFLLRHEHVAQHLVKVGPGTEKNTFLSTSFSGKGQGTNYYFFQKYQVVIAQWLARRLATEVVPVSIPS